VDERLNTEISESPAKAVLRHSVMTFGTRMAIVLVNIPTSIMIARLLGTDGQGAYASAVVFPAMFAFIGLMGLDSAHTFLISRKRYELAQVNGQSLLLMLVLSAVITPLYRSSWPSTCQWHSSSDSSVSDSSTSSTSCRPPSS
jgi:O-antigen/teichoic acid export membrane protein